MSDDSVVVIDCGATNISVGAVASDGRLLSLAQARNQVVEQPAGEPGWYVWDLDRVWQGVATASAQVCRAIGSENIRAILLTTFGTGGAPVGADRALLYPVISSYDSRCQPLAAPFRDRVLRIYETCGHPPSSWRNSNLLRVLWLRQHAPETLDRAKAWLTMPGLLNLRLTGELSLDTTSASTIGALNLATRQWSEEILDLAGIDASLFPPLIEPGTQIGTVTREAHRATGFPEGVPVLAAGHDTQFALIGSGARPDEALVSSGTLELLLIGETRFKMTAERLEAGLVTQLDARQGMWNTSMTLIGGSVLEWIRKTMYPHLDRGEAYATIAREAEEAGVGSRGLTLLPAFLPDVGPTRKLETRGTMLGLTLFTTRGDCSRAALEGLSFQLRAALASLHKQVGRSISGLRVVGGGSRNMLWNRIRADVTGLPITTNACSEATILGAAMLGYVALGEHPSLEKARGAFHLDERVIEAGKPREEYDTLYRRYLTLPEALRAFYA